MIQHIKNLIEARKHIIRYKSNPKKETLEARQAAIEKMWDSDTDRKRTLQWCNDFTDEIRDFNPIADFYKMKLHGNKEK